MKLNNNLIKQLIKEAIADRIKMIDEAGDIAALEAKINKVEEDIKDAMAVKSSLVSMAGLKYYVSPEIIGDMMDDMEVSIKELQAKKKELEDSKKVMSKGDKKPAKKEDKKELNENNADNSGKDKVKLIGFPKNPKDISKYTKIGFDVKTNNSAEMDFKGFDAASILGVLEDCKQANLSPVLYFKGKKYNIEKAIELVDMMGVNDTYDNDGRGTSLEENKSKKKSLTKR